MPWPTCPDSSGSWPCRKPGTRYFLFFRRHPALPLLLLALRFRIGARCRVSGVRCQKNRGSGLRGREFNRGFKIPDSRRPLITPFARRIRNIYSSRMGQKIGLSGLLRGRNPGNRTTPPKQQALMAYSTVTMKRGYEILSRLSLTGAGGENHGSGSSRKSP